MTAYAVLNDESMRIGDPTGDGRLLLTLVRTFLALQRAVPVYDEDRVQACVTDAIHRIVLPSGANLQAALGALGRTCRSEANRLRSLLVNNVQTFDEHGNAEPSGVATATEVAFPATGEPRAAPSLRAAWLLRGLAWSADHPDWQIEKIPIKVRDAPGSFRDEHLANAYRPEIGPGQRAVLAQHVTVLPVFDHEDHRHDPSHAGYLQGKSHIPKHAERILRYAVPVNGGMTWWARCACGFYHRFQGSQQQQELGRARVHWNATTNEHATGNQPKQGVPTMVSDVPPDVKDRLAKNARYRALGEADCGCRELRGPGRA